MADRRGRCRCRRGLHPARQETRGLRAARTIAIAAVTGAFLLPLAWTGLAAVGVLPDDSMRPPSWTGPPTLDHLANIGIAEPTFWQELATSTVAAIVAACLTVAVAFPAAFALTRSRYSRRPTVTQGFLVLASLPVVAYVIPLADLSRRGHLIATFAGITLPEAAPTAPPPALPPPPGGGHLATARA